MANTIKILNNSGLDTTKYTVWVAGFINGGGSVFYTLQSNGSFSTTANSTTAPFCNANEGLTIIVPDLQNYGNNRLIFLVTPRGTTPPPYPILVPYTAYPFNNTPSVCPPGLYDIFEFAPTQSSKPDVSAGYDVTAVDGFGLNLSFTVDGSTTYGPVPTVSRLDIGRAFLLFIVNEGQFAAPFSQLLYYIPSGAGYPPQIDSQFAAIVAPKNWLAIYPDAIGLSGYWDETVNDFFQAGNQLNFYLNAATVGTYTGRCDGDQYTLTGPAGTITIPKSDFQGNQCFVQVVRGQNPGESDAVYQAFNQIEAAIFEAFSRGVALDGVIPQGQNQSSTYSSDAWTNTANWYANHPNTYNGKQSVYDVYAKFLHCSSANGTTNGNTIFGKNSGGTFGMAYGFSIDENPNVGSTWPTSQNVPAEDFVTSGQTVTITIGDLGIPRETPIPFRYRIRSEIDPTCTEKQFFVSSPKSCSPSFGQLPQDFTTSNTGTITIIGSSGFTQPIPLPLRLGNTYPEGNGVNAHTILINSGVSEQDGDPGVKISRP